MTAIRMVTLAARNLVHRTTPSPGTQGTSTIKMFGHCLGATGLTEEAACAEGFDAVSITVTELAFTDFFFLPHFSKPWNLLNIAALQAE